MAFLIDGVVVVRLGFDIGTDAMCCPEEFYECQWFCHAASVVFSLQAGVESTYESL